MTLHDILKNKLTNNQFKVRIGYKDNFYPAK